MRTTAKQFEFFVKECQYWVDRLSLNGFRWIFQHKKLNGFVAECYQMYDQRRMVVTLNTEIENPVDYSRNSLKRTAFEEVFEGYLDRLRAICEHRSDKEDVTSEMHGVVHRIWNIVKAERGIK
jgi:hypothetical protein